jgi:myo-inositol-1(or 4)-monophosphatase
VPVLPPAARAVVERGTVVAAGALDELRSRLVRESGERETEAGVAAKADGTPVTELDRAADELLATRLTAAFPDHGVLSEEGRTVAPDTEWTWIVDPIDGTSNFTAGLPYWCTAVGLALDGAPVLGIIDAPVLGRRYVASIGEGAHLERRTTSLDGTTDSHRRSRLHVRGAVDWRRGGHGHVPVMLTTGTVRRVRDVGLQLNPRVMGSTALDLAMVAEGVAAASVAVIPKVWDIAAGMVLVREAGGVALEFGDQPLFPVRAGEEHRARSTPFVAGPDERYVRDLAAAFLGSP